MWCEGPKAALHLQPLEILAPSIRRERSWEWHFHSNIQSKHDHRSHLTAEGIEAREACTGAQNPAAG